MSGSALAIAATTACGGASNAGLFGSGGSVQGSGGTAARGGNGSGARGGRGAGGSGAGGTRGTGGSGAGGSGAGGTRGTGGSGAGGSGAGGTGAGGMAGTGGGATGGTSGFGGTGGTGGFGATGGTGGFGGTGGSGGYVGIACGSATCSVGTDFCCDFNNKAPACNPIGTQCFPSTDLYCDGPEDCPSGQMCCGQLVQLQNGQYEYNEVRCSSTCGYAQNQRVFCHNSSQCNSNQTCQQSQTLPAYTVCGY